MFQWLLVHTVVTAAMALVVAASCRWRRLSPAVRHLLWLAVLVKLLTPPVVCWPWPLPVFGSSPAPPPPADSPAAETRTIVIVDQEPIADRAPAGEGAEAAAPAGPLLPPPPAADVPAAPSFSWDWMPTAAAGAWLAGAAWVALRNGMRILRWRRKLACGPPAPEWLTILVRELADPMRLRPPRLVVLPGAASPMVWGFGAPRLIWPLGLEDRLSAEGRRAVLIHELAHLRRRDHWVGWLLLAAGCVWWWHPLFWWVRRKLTQEAELACDAWVVGTAPDARRAYAEALLEVSQRLASTAAVPALGAAGGRRDLERRLVMIMRGPATRRLSWAGLAGVGVLGLLALPAWTLGEDPRTPAAPPRDQPASQATPPGGNPFGVALPGGPATGAASGGAPAAAAPADAERDKKIQELEDKVQQLLKELQELRGQASEKPRPALVQPPGTTDANAAIKFLSAFQKTEPTTPQATPLAAGETPGEVITLTRVSYKLKPATAEALAGFLKDNVKASILETKVAGETLVITTTPDAQDAIGQFIGLIQGKTMRRPGMMGPSGMPGMGGSSGFMRGGMGGPPPGSSGGPYGPMPGGRFGPGPGSSGGPPPGATYPPGPGGTFGPLPAGPPPGSSTPFPRPGGPGGPTPPPGSTSGPPGQ